jgi:hypothetical protein
VLNRSISRDDKVKLTKCQNHHHHGVYLTYGPSGLNPRPKGPKGWPAKLLGRPIMFYVGLACGFEDTYLHVE